MKKIALLFLILISMLCCFLGCNNADAEEITEEEGTIYTSRDIYIGSYECGYREEYEKIRYGTVIIETEEQLIFAEDCLLQTFRICTFKTRSLRALTRSQQREKRLQTYPKRSGIYPQQLPKHRTD